MIIIETNFVNLTEEMKDIVIESIMENVEFTEIDINLDDFELEIEYSVKIDIKDIQLSKKDKYDSNK